MFSSFIDTINNMIHPLSFSEIKEKLLKKEKINLEIKGNIVSHIKFENLKYLNLNIQIGKQNCNDFIYIYDETNPLKDGNEINFNLNKIKFTSANNKCYIEIIDPIIKNSIKILEKNIQLFNFGIFQFVTIYNEIVFNNKKEDLFSIILKVKEIEESNQCEYQFYDLNNELVPVNYEDIKNEIEGQKIYIFNSFKYVKEQLTPLKYSTVIPIDNNNIIFNDDFTINKGEKVTSFFGEIKSFILGKNVIKVIDKNQNELTVELNIRLFRKILLRCQCKFQSFLKNSQESNSFKFTNFSDIYPFEKTTILFEFIGIKRDYDHKFGYQINSQADDETKLKKKFNIIIDGKEFQFKNYETYENKFKNRIIFINIPNDLKNIINENLESNINDLNNIKILKLINYKENENKFKLLLEKEQKGKINYKYNVFSLINSFYDQYFCEIFKLEKDSKNIKLKENIYHKLFYEEKEIKKFEKYIKNGFDNFIFKDNEQDYQFIKKICFAYLYNAKKESDFISFLLNYKRNILNMNDLYFIERIRIIIALINEYSGQKNASYISISLIGDINYNNNVNEAHKIFLEIIDGLKEECYLYHVIHQFNSIIREEMDSNEIMYSDSILTLNDIK